MVDAAPPARLASRMDDRSTDTIVAPATAPGQAAIAIIRLSGSRAHAVFQHLFRAHRADGRPWRSHQLVHGVVVSVTGETLDDALGVVMHGPRTYTGEDTAEFQVHGSPAVVSTVLEACVAAGARLAQPGEFTRRAVMNGRLDLARAEAVADLIAAQTAASRRAALRQLTGQISSEVNALRSQLLDIAAHIEAALDFPDEAIPAAETATWLDTLQRVSSTCQRLLASHKRGRVARAGFRVVIVGAPNAGKSSLFNALVGHERAIVTPHAGTTRDTIESTVEMSGVAVTFVDTAGLRDAGDPIEQIGIRRAAGEMSSADLILHVVDASLPFVPLPYHPPEGVPVIRVLNKSDLLRDPPDKPCTTADTGVFVSTLTQQGMETLEQMISEHLACEPATGEILVTNARHAACLREAVTSLQHAIEALTVGLSGDLIMVDLRSALRSLGEITGVEADEEILDRIFCTFCLGK